MDSTRLKNKIIAKVITRFPFLSGRFIDSYSPWESDDVPWTHVTKPLNDSKIAIVTTAGVHHTDQVSFDMKDKNGDPSYRVIDSSRSLSELTITHNYYDHTNASRDINIIFPIERLWEFEREGFIGKVADRHYGLMGHIDGHHIYALVNATAPEIARGLREDNVDAVLLTPG